MSGDFLSVDTYDFLFILSHMNNIKTLNNEIIEASGGTGGETVLFQRARLTRLSKELGVFCQLQDVSSANCRMCHLPTARYVICQLQDVSADNCRMYHLPTAGCVICQLQDVSSANCRMCQQPTAGCVSSQLQCVGGVICQLQNVSADREHSSELAGRSMFRHSCTGLRWSRPEPACRL